MEASSIDQSEFLQRHLGPTPKDQEQMLKALGYPDLQSFVLSVVPSEILDRNPPLGLLPEGCNEIDALKELLVIARKNKQHRSLIGLGYHGTVMPAVIQRHVFENPAWYTAYTPYQSEIAQGRLEALFNFQTLISELTGLPIANASLLDEASAAAEAMSLSFGVRKNNQAFRFLVDKDVLPQTLSVLRTRAEPLDLVVEIAEPSDFQLDETVFGVFLQLPGCSGRLWDPTNSIDLAHSVGALVTVAIDPLAQVLMKPIGALGADIAVGSAQRFGVPMGFGGPHAAFFSTREAFKRQIPGRLVGQSIDSEGSLALRLALQTREQHIRRDKATSNICTAQVLLAVIASFYAVHHGPQGLEKIALKIVNLRKRLEQDLIKLGYPFKTSSCFDSIEVYCLEAPEVHRLSNLEGFNFRILPLGSSPEKAKGFGITFDELSTDKELDKLHQILAKAIGKADQKLADLDIERLEPLPGIPLRSGLWLEQPAFNSYRSETEILRYINQLANRDFSLVHGMIPLGSCTMKLNSAAELVPISWNEFSSLHPFIPNEQSDGYKHLVNDLQNWLSAITGFAGVSLQPNAGSQGELAGLLVIRAWHKDCGNQHRNICLIPTSAHGTNPASSVMAGLRVVSVECDDQGNIDLDDLRKKVVENSSELAALMVTYPSTHGVFEPNICEICELVHLHGGQVYLDGANLNAQVGLCRPGLYGADVCHLNLHKTFCIPHGGGGPGIGPIAVASHLLPFLPGHPLSANVGGKNAIGSVSAAPFGSAGILAISWMYIRMMGATGLRKASSVALLSANYIAHVLDPYYPVLFRGLNGLVAHECILDLRPIKKKTGISVDDIAKRLMDYGFHAPTVSWPVAGTLMVEPTESESFEEINRFCEAMIAISQEVKAVERGHIDSLNNPLRCSPHTLRAVTSEVWDRPYSRQQAAFPLPGQLKWKFWPAVARIDNAYGDRNLVCTCSTFEEVIDD